MFPVRNGTGVSFKNVVLTSDLQMIVALAADKTSREALHIFNVKTGVCISKIPIKVPGVKVRIRVKYYCCALYVLESITYYYSGIKE